MFLSDTDAKKSQWLMGVSAWMPMAKLKLNPGKTVSSHGVQLEKIPNYFTCLIPKYAGHLELFGITNSFTVFYELPLSQNARQAKLQRVESCLAMIKTTI